MNSSEKQVKMKKNVDNEIITIYPVNRTEDVEGLISALANKSDITHSHTKSDITDFPESMKNPTDITITLNGGDTEGDNKFTYNGSEAKTIDITPDSIGAADTTHTHNKSDINGFPESMKNPNSIILSLNSGTIEGTNKFTYDGSSSKTINITPDSIGINTMKGATSSSDGKSGIVPTPSKGKQTSFLRGDGTWAVPTDTNTWRPVENVLTSSSSSNSLSANQGKVLKELVDGKADMTHIHSKSDIIDFPTSMPASDVSSWAKASSKPTYTKTDVGLGNVENKSSETIRNELTSDNVTTALGYTPLNSNLKGAKNGLAELGEDGKILSNQLPSSIDEIIEGYVYNGDFYSDINHKTEITGESGKIYVDLLSNKTYRWSGSAFIVISDTIALGETSSTAYRGDRGKIAYEHSQSTHAPSNAEANQNAFTYISVTSGATTIKVIADNPTDTLSITAGDNITLTGDDTTDKITISAKDTTYKDATQTEHGLLSISDKTKLDGIEQGANLYTLPVAGSELGGVKTTSSVVSNVGYLPIPIIDGVPYYKDTNTEYGVGSATELGLTKLYTSVGTKTDGTMTQQAINSALSFKIGVGDVSTKDLNTVINRGLYYGRVGNTTTNKPEGVNAFSVFVYQLSSSSSTGITRQDMVVASSKLRFTREYDSSTNKWTEWVPMPTFSDIPTDNEVIISDVNGQLSSSGYTIKSSVPENAKFTDTTYKDATQTEHGLLSISDKTKLDSIEQGATKNNQNPVIIKLDNGDTEGTNKFTYDGNEAKTINITPAKINAVSRDGDIIDGSLDVNGILTANSFTVKSIDPFDENIYIHGSIIVDESQYISTSELRSVGDKITVNNFSGNGLFEVLDSTNHKPLITTEDLGEGGSDEQKIYIGDIENSGYTFIVNDLRGFRYGEKTTWGITLNGEASFSKIEGPGSIYKVIISTTDTKSSMKCNSHYVCSDTMSVTNAIRLAINLVSNGGTIVLLDGTYTVNYDDGPIIINKNNITIEGSGWNTVVKSSIKNNASTSIFKITGSDVILKNMMLTSENPTTAAPLILQQSEGAMYDNLFFILTNSASSTGGCAIKGTNSCNYTRINNCRIYKSVSESAGLPTFDYGYATSFSGIIHECFHSDGRTNITVRFANTTQQNSTVISATKTTNTILSV